MKIKDIRIAIESGSLETIGNQSIGGANAFKVAHLKRQLNPIYDDYIKQRNDIIVKLGEKDADGEYYISQDSPNLKKFKAEIKSIDDLDIDISPIEINISQEADWITANLINNLYDVIKINL